MKRILRKLLPVAVKDFLYRTKAKLTANKLKRRIPSLQIRKNTSDLKVFEDIFVRNEFDLLLDFDPQIIIDGGAYVGFSSIYFTLKYPEATIFSVEAEEGNFKQLSLQTKHLKNIVPINKGLWNKNSFLKIVDNNLGNWGFSVEEVSSAKDADINAITINEIISNYDLPRIDILKLDIEGAEIELFESNTDWLEKVNCLVIELHDRIRPGCEESVKNKMSSDVWQEKRSGEKVVFTRIEIIREDIS